MQISTLLSLVPSSPTRARWLWRPQLAACMGSLLMLVAGNIALAHESSYPISGDWVRVQAAGGPSTSVFEFRVENEEGLLLAHDPSSEGFFLLVRGSTKEDRRS